MSPVTAVYTSLDKKTSEITTLFLLHCTPLTLISKLLAYAINFSPNLSLRFIQRPYVGAGLEYNVVMELVLHLRTNLLFP